MLEAKDKIFAQSALLPEQNTLALALRDLAT